VKDPFYKHMPAHFEMTFEELLAAKHPTTWIDFERGLLTESQALERFFSDGRTVDADRLKAMLVNTVCWCARVDGV
jgi:FMN hydrolase / 5-amino-6-(5-phospho-D-ribitylamino)uracil phosphatase